MLFSGVCLCVCACGASVPNLFYEIESIACGELRAANVYIYWFLN